MKDFPYWRGAIYNAKTPQALKAVGEDLSQFQSQTGFLRDEEKKLNAAQVATLRTQYSEKMAKLTAEFLPTSPLDKPKFNK